MMNREGSGVKYISADEFDEIGVVRKKGEGWASKYQSVLLGLGADEAVVLPCMTSCWASRSRHSCSAATLINHILGAGNYSTRHLEKRGTPNNRIAVKKLRQEER